MRIKKKVLWYSLTIILVSSSLTYAAAAKNIWRAGQVAAKKIETPAVEVSDVEKTPDAPVVTDTPAVSDAPAADASDTKTIETPSKVSQDKTTDEYPVHKNISTTYFWAGEEADADNKNISNLPSAWDDDWAKHFGGVDDPKHRNGFLPAAFTPKENPFYFALPYNDFNSKGNQKNDSVALAIWGKPKSGDSMCKNQWIKITKGGKTVYAQWEDVGPFGEDDKAYVFGGATPKSKENSHAGLDVSPAVHDYLGLSDVDKTDWQFVDASAVPDGPWKKIVTTSQVFWK